MPTRRSITTVLLAVSTAGWLSAQTFIVDAGNGPGTHFTSISAAVSAVPDGAVLDVRAGTYTPFSVAGKSMTILGSPGVVVTGLAAVVTISGLQAGQAVTLRGIALHSVLRGSALICQDCRGAILLEDCDANPLTSSVGGQLDITDCDQVSVRGCWFGGTLFAAEVANSNVALTHCILSAHPLGSAISTLDSDVSLSNSIAWSAIGATILVGGGRLAITGHSTLRKSVLTAPTAVIEGTGRVAVHPNTTIDAPGSPNYAGVVVTTAITPEVGAWTEPLGGTATAELRVPPGATGALFVGLPGAPTTFSGLPDPIWIRAGSAVLRATGSGILTASYAVPSAPSTLGTLVLWQGVTLGPGGLAASNPVVYVHH